MLLRFHDPDNPASLYVWGIQPARRKRRMLALARVFAGPMLLLLWFYFYYSDALWVLFANRRPIWFYWMGNFLNTGLVLGVLPLLRPLSPMRDNQSYRELVRDLSLAGASNGEIAEAFARPTILAAHAMCLCYVLGIYLSAAFEEFYPMLLPFIANWMMQLHLSGRLDAAMRLRREGRWARIAESMFMIVSSPLNLLFIPVVIARFDLYKIFVPVFAFAFMSELLVTAIRYKSVRLIWEEAVDQLVEAG